ncbi:two-component system regulatory protein YycI [Chryseomicrobium palamuruense]|uniref:Two-component system regulatory protein YycI n=1 Tax=Chryseomicrobium palamuruense TaxID=682973 RepID=A0ABV8UW80_9BACL
MDWSRTKTIFIVVFSILNVMLMWLYLDRYNESIGLQGTLTGTTPIEESLTMDNIEVPRLANMPNQVAYVSGTVHNFTPEELDMLENVAVTIESADVLMGTLMEPVAVSETMDLETIVQEHAFNGDEYEIWSSDAESRTAVFFQQVNERDVYYNTKATIEITWNENNEVTGFTQTYLDNLEDYNEERTLISYMSAIEVLYNRALLQPGSDVINVELGYSTLAQLGETQVFSPTWSVLIELPDGTMKEYFVNAIDSRVLDIPIDSEESDDTEE